MAGGEARILAAAQYAALAGDVEGNLARHLRYGAAAASLGVKLLVFPELSLTGYEPERAAELAMDAADARLSPLKTLAQRAGMTLIVGVPVRYGALHIGAFAILPDGKVAVYTKQHLHAGERAVFAPGHGGPMLRLGRARVAMAVCADTAEASHAANAAALGAKVYAASVLVSEAGYAADAELLRGYAKTHGMVVVMANHAAATGGWAPAGRSAIWDEQGGLVAAGAGCEEALVLARRQGQGWEGAVFPMSDAVARVVDLPTGLRDAGLGAQTAATSRQGQLFGA